MVSRSFVTRPPLKQLEIERVLRQRMLTGDLPPSARFPRRDDLQEEFSVSRDTIQRVFDQLLADGFIIANGRAGTFVVERPPHLHRFALLFPEPVSRWSRFWHALHREASVLSQGGERELVCFPDTVAHPDNRAFAELLHDVRALRLAGIILASPPGGLAGTPILAEPRIPCVSIMLGPPLPGLPALYPDMSSFDDRALDEFAAQGHRRIAVLTTPGYANDHLRAGLVRRGMDGDPRLMQAIDPAGAPWARNCAQLLVSGPDGRRPDALLITDDNLVEHAMAGVAAAGVRVPADLPVIGHCNFPWPTPSMLPIRRLGFDAREVLRGCLERLDEQRAGLPPRMETRVPARFEDEVPS